MDIFASRAERDKQYKLQGCTMCQTVFNYRNETPPPLNAHFGRDFFI